METSSAVFTDSEEEILLQRFRSTHPEFFQKNDARLFLHLGIVSLLLACGTAAVIIAPWIPVKMILGVANSFLIFALINVTIHHHHTHHNAAKNLAAKRFLDLLYVIVVPNAPKRRSRYTRSHLNHHARPFHETDVDHHYGKNRYLRMMRNFRNRIFYFLELTFVGGHVPGWEDDRYMNQVPIEAWRLSDYETVKQTERHKAFKESLWQWGGFALLLWILPVIAWAWAFPMLLVKNWAHFLGQFQHYDERFSGASSVWNSTKAFRIPAALNYLAGGEINGHFLHHLFPELPYYNVESARRRFLQDPELVQHFVIY